MRIYLILSVFCLLAACSSREGETRAHITQRRTVAAGRLLINYEFRVGGQLFLDSMETANRGGTARFGSGGLFAPESPGKPFTTTLKRAFPGRVEKPVENCLKIFVSKFC